MAEMIEKVTGESYKSCESYRQKLQKLPGPPDKKKMQKSCGKDVDSYRVLWYAVGGKTKYKPVMRPGRLSQAR